MTAPRILVVEDERIIALHLRQRLTDLGYDVPNAVSTGDQALRKIQESPPDLILMDINLKGKLDGIATAAAIPPEYRIPVIYLTAYSSDATLARAVATNPSGYLVKPFSERELHAMIQVTLARSRAEGVSRAVLESRQQTRKMQALSQLAGGLADEVDDLLSTLYGQLETLGTRAVSEPDLAEPLRDAFNIAIEKERLVNVLLDFSGRRTLMPAAVSVSALVTDATTQLKRLVGDSVDIRPAFPDDLWHVRMDPIQLTRALSNLAANACDAMPNGGSLTIEGQNAILDQGTMGDGADVAAGRYVLLSLADTGSGMSERVVERAFEPFFSARAAGGGTGLGLSLVFGFIRQSGGHISIDSEPGRGTTVRLYLPAVADDTVSAALPAGGGFDWTAQSDPADDGPPPWSRTEHATRVAPGESRRGNFRHAISRGTPAATSPDAASPVLWQKAEDVMFASVPIRPGALRFRLIVEPLPRRNGWDWVVWRPGDVQETSRHGRASSVVSAMAAAEDATRHWDQTGPGSE